MHEMSVADDEAPRVPSPLVEAAVRLWQIAVLRRRTLLLATGLAAACAAAFWAIAPRRYAATAKLLIIERNRDQLASVAESFGSDNTMRTHQELVTSARVIEEAIGRLAPEHRVDLASLPPDEWVDEAAARLSAATIRKTNFIEVTYRSADSEAAAAMVGSIIDAYLNFVEQTHRGSANELIELLTRKEAELRVDLAEKQAKLQDLRQSIGHLTAKSDGSVVEPVIQRALRLNESFMQAQAERLDLEASLAALDEALARGDAVQQFVSLIEKSVGPQMLLSTMGLSPQDLELVTSQERKILEAEAELERLAPYLGPAHPRIVELHNGIRATQQFLAAYGDRAKGRLAGGDNGELGRMLRAALQQSLAQAQSRERQIAATFDQVREEASQHASGIVQLEMLEREVSRLETQYSDMLNQIASLDVHQLQAPIQASVVQEPLPDERPVFPRLRAVLLCALGGGLGVGGLIAYVQDVLDDRFASPEDMKLQLRAPVLAIVRLLKPLEGEGLQAVHSFAHDQSADAEAFRTLRTALTLAGERSEKILVSSSEPGDGKTTVAANLAVALARAGKRTLIIDADLRKPGLTALLGLKAAAGAAEILLAEEPIDQAAARHRICTDLAELHVIPAGIRRANPAELLSSDRFADLLAWAESNYDQVLVDCPPVLAVSDAQIVGRVVDGALLVVRPAKNHRRMVLRAVDSFRGTGGKLLGLVANGIQDERGQYSYGYGYGYGAGYGDPQPDPAPAIPALAAHAARGTPDHSAAGAPPAAAPSSPRRAA